MVSANGPRRQDRSRDTRTDLTHNMNDDNGESREQFYRKTTLAKSLQEVLNDFEVQGGEINEIQSDFIMWQLD